MPGENSQFESALADLGLGFISAPLNYKGKTPIPKSLATQSKLLFSPFCFSFIKTLQRETDFLYFNAVLPALESRLSVAYTQQQFSTYFHS